MTFPDPHAAGTPAAAAPAQFQPGIALGGAAPVHVDPPRRSDRRDLVLSAVLLVAALVAGGASLLSWRDYGVRLDPSVPESGWVQADGSIGRGWAAVLLAVVLAVGGVLIAAHRAGPGRRVAVGAGIGLVVLSIVEFGLGAGSLHTGPGAGLWTELVVGIVVVAAVGMLTPASTDPDRPTPS